MKLTKLTAQERITHRRNLGIKWRNAHKQDPIYVEQERLRHQKVNNRINNLLCIQIKYLLYQFRKVKKEKFVDLEEKLRTSDASLRTSDASAADLKVQLGKLDSKLKKIDEKSKEKKHLKKEILRVLKKNSLRKSTRNKVKELNIGFFPRNKVKILTGVISLDLVQEQEVISKKILNSIVFIFFLISFRDISRKRMSNETL